MNLWEKAINFVASTSTFGQSAVDAWQLNSDVDSQLSKLRATVPKVCLLIERAECWRCQYKNIDELLSQLKDLVYEAKTLLRESRRRNQTQMPGQFIIDYLRNWMGGILKKANNLEGELNCLYDSLEKICNALGIPENPNEFTRTARPLTSSVMAEPKVYGREKELEDVICLLGVPGSRSSGRKRLNQETVSALTIASSSGGGGMEDQGAVTCVPIVGMGGIGKTTLAQMVYNDPRVNSYYDLKFWVCISETFDITRITKQIVDQCPIQNKNEFTSLNSLQVALQETLRYKRFLLVLDDVWSTENIMVWQNLLGPIKGGANGSAVIVTSRYREVGLIAGTGMRSMGPVNLGLLDEKRSWELFNDTIHRASGLEWDTVSQNCPDLIGIGKKICRKMKGIPLALKSVGGALGSDLDMDNWLRITDSKIWELEQGEHDIFPALRLSYQHLPSHLKRCFSVAASPYPKGYEFTQKELFQLWVRHSIVSPQENEDGKTLAARYFNTLWSRCFFEKAPPDRHDRFVIHDLIHDTLTSFTKDECFCIFNEDHNKKPSPNIRHLSVFHRSFNLNELCNYKKLVTLMLRQDISELAESIKYLNQLQCLDISGSPIEALPECIGDLYNLWYLNMEGCQKIKRFPKRLNELVSLEYFYLPSDKVPLVAHMPNVVKAIETTDLKYIITSEAGHRIENLRLMNKVRGRLLLGELQNVSSKEDAEKALISNKRLIDSLVLSWDGRRSLSWNELDTAVIEGLRPHRNLRKLELVAYGDKILSPSWLDEISLPHIAEVSFNHCWNHTFPDLPRSITKVVIANCHKVRTLQNCLLPSRLPFLQHINIYFCDALESLPVESFNEFGYLERLEIQNCPKLRCPQKMVLPPSVKYLKLRYCGDLENSIPSCLQNLTALKELSISKCPCLIAIPAEVACNLISLSYLSVADCKELKLLGGWQFLASVQSLYVTQCPKLKDTSGQDINGSLTSAGLFRTQVSLALKGESSTGTKMLTCSPSSSRYRTRSSTSAKRARIC